MTTIPSEDHHQHRTQNVPQVMTGGDSGIASSCERPKKESDVDDAQSLSPTTKGCCTPPTISFRGEECCEKRKSRSCGSGGGVRQKITHVYCGFSQSLLLENTASVARDHLGKLLLFFSYLCNSPRLQRERERERAHGPVCLRRPQKYLPNSDSKRTHIFSMVANIDGPDHSGRW